MRRAILTFLLALILAAPAQAASQKDLDDCRQHEDADRRIAGCTRVINAGPSFKGAAHLKEAYYNRGWPLYFSKNDGEGALFDFRAVVSAPSGGDKAASLDSKAGAQLSAIQEKLDRERRRQSRPAQKQAEESGQAAAEPQAASEQAWDNCSGDEPKLIVAGCTQIVEDENTPPTDLGVAYNNRGTGHLELEDYDRAIDDYIKAESYEQGIAGNLHLAYHRRGLAHRAKGEYDQAIAEFDDALRIDKVFVPAYADRGIAYMRKGDRARAGVNFRAALALPEGNEIDKAAHEAARHHLEMIEEKRLAERESLAAKAEAFLDEAEQVAAAEPRAEPVQAAPLGKRVALVIGNSDYASVSKLPNPARDAAKVAEALTATARTAPSSRRLCSISRSRGSTCG